MRKGCRACCNSHRAGHRILHFGTSHTWQSSSGQTSDIESTIMLAVWVCVMPSQLCRIVGVRAHSTVMISKITECQAGQS